MTTDNRIKETPEQKARRASVDAEVARLAKIDLESSSLGVKKSAPFALLQKYKPKAFETIAHATCPFVRSGSKHVHVVRDGRFAKAVIDTDAASKCGECSGALHSIEYDEHNYRFSRPCEGARLEKRARLFSHASIPASFDFATLAPSILDDSYTHQLYANALEWCENMTPGDRGLWYSGSVGTGKTHLVCAILRHLTLERGIRCVFIRFATLLQRLKRSFNARPNDDLEDILEPFAAIPVLAIDDLGASRSLFEIDTFELLVSDIMERSGVTLIVASNYTPRQLATKAGGNKSQNTKDALAPMTRTASRLRELVATIPVYGKDRREGR